MTQGSRCAPDDVIVVVDVADDVADLVDVRDADAAAAQQVCSTRSTLVTTRMLGKIEVPVAEDVAVAVLVMEAVVDGRISTGCPPRVLGSLMMAAAKSEVPSSCVTGIAHTHTPY